MLSVIRQHKNKTQMYEYYPNHPNTIVLRNEYYPRGITELNLYNYYTANKNIILTQTKNRELMFFLAMESGIVVKRKTPDGSFIKLNSSNYENLITGRTLSIHSTMQNNENFGIVDVDSNDFRKSKNATADVYDYLKSLREFKNLEIRYTGKEGFHIVCFMNQKKHIDEIRNLLKEHLNNKFKGKYEIAYHKKLGAQVNLDLSSNKYRGGFITLDSLSVLGLRCMKVSRGKLPSFRKDDAKIKLV